MLGRCACTCVHVFVHVSVCVWSSASNRISVLACWQSKQRPAAEDTASMSRELSHRRRAPAQQQLPHLYAALSAPISMNLYSLVLRARAEHHHSFLIIILNGAKKNFLEMTLSVTLANPTCQLCVYEFRCDNLSAPSHR